MVTREVTNDGVAVTYEQDLEARRQEHFQRILALLGFDPIDLVEREGQYARAKEVSRLYRKMMKEISVPSSHADSVLALHQHTQALLEYERLLRKEHIVPSQDFQQQEQLLDPWCHCDEPEPVPYEDDGPLGHGFMCNACGKLLQVG